MSYYFNRTTPLMNSNRLAALFLILAACSSAAQPAAKTSNAPGTGHSYPCPVTLPAWHAIAPATPQRMAVIKDVAEYRALMAAMDLQDPKQKVAAMEAFIVQYPQSAAKGNALVREWFPSMLDAGHDLQAAIKTRWVQSLWAWSV